MNVIINTIIIIIINKIIFTFCCDIFCNSNKILIKSFSNISLISIFSTFNVQILYFNSILLLPVSIFVIQRVVLILLQEFRINLSHSICHIQFSCFFITRQYFRVISIIRSNSIIIIIIIII